MTRAIIRGAVLVLVLASGTSCLAHAVHPGQIGALTQGGLVAYLWAGAVHMLTGYDHLLFLLGVMFFLSTLKDIVAFITAFTIGHSLTLIAGTLYGIQANYYVIDAVIALSVAYKGFENLEGFRRWLQMAPPPLLGMVFGFGLIHGLGLATRLQHIGLPVDGLVPRLLAFNLGVELGQIAVLVVMTALLALMRRSASYTSFGILANTCLVIVGGLLFLMQSHSYLHTRHPDEFGFSSNLHYVEHLEDSSFGDTPAEPATQEEETEPGIGPPTEIPPIKP